MTRLLFIAAIAAAVAAACGGASETAPPPPAAEPAPTTTEVPATTAPVETAPVAVECAEQALESQGNEHVTELPEGFEYNSFPPTSGPHHPEPAPWNAYTEPVPQLHLVHNLEHGGVVVQYGPDVGEETVRSLLEWYATDPDGIVVAPLPELGAAVALTAWQHLLTCDGFDEAAFTTFRDEYRFNGPEKIPREHMKPLSA